MKDHLESEILKLIIEMDKRQEMWNGSWPNSRNKLQKDDKIISENELNYKVHKKE